MTDLSPQAQAVLDAFRAVPDLRDCPSIATHLEHRLIAALRAAAEEVVPYEATAPWDELKCDYDGDHWEMRQYVRDKFLAIATELKGSND